MISRRSTSRKLSDGLSSLKSDCYLLLGEANSEAEATLVTGRTGERKHVLIRVPFGIYQCSGDHPEGASYVAR